MICTRLALGLALSLSLACGGESSMTTTSDSGGSTVATDPGTTTGATASTTSGMGGTSGTGELPTGGSGGGTDGATGGTSEQTGTSTGELSGSGTGGQGSAIACEAWYDALYDSYAPQCECEVEDGNYRTVEECQGVLAPASDCACSIFADAPETVELLKCYQKAAEGREKCLGGIAQCLLGDLLQGCIDDELVALLACGAPSDAICMDLQRMCGGEVPPVCGP